MSTLDTALEMLAHRGAEFGPGLSNHGPMAAEALVALGRDDAVEAWVGRYRSRLDERDAERTPIREGEWRDALGAAHRIGDWNAFFERRLREAPANEVLSEWLPRLAGGAMAAAAHGLIRTAHAVRAMAADPTDLRVREVAAGLGYWAARYQELPGGTRGRGTLTPADALARVPVIAEEDRGAFLIFDQVRAVGRVPSYVAAVDAVALAPDADVALDAIIDAAARAYVGCDRRAEIAFVHGVTGPSALRVLLPYMPAGARSVAAGHAWLVVAAIRSAYGARELPVVADDAEQPNDATWDDLADRAVAGGAGDEHAIKMVEACRREHARTGSSVLLNAARRAAGAPIA